MPEIARVAELVRQCSWGGMHEIYDNPIRQWPERTPAPFPVLLEAAKRKCEDRRAVPEHATAAGVEEVIGQLVVELETDDAQIVQEEIAAAVYIKRPRIAYRRFGVDVVGTRCRHILEWRCKVERSDWNQADVSLPLERVDRDLKKWKDLGSRRNCLFPLITLNHNHHTHLFLGPYSKESENVVQK